MTESETKGEIGLIEGRIGIGAALDGKPFAQVARLVLFGRGFWLGICTGSVVFECVGCGRVDATGGATCDSDWVGTIGALLSRVTSDFLNQEEVLVVRLGTLSDGSFWSSLMLDFLLLRIRYDEEVFGLRGSNASAK